MTQDELQTLLHTLITQWENEIIEFKQASKDFKLSELGQYFSALSNEANLRHVENACLFLA
jgi:ATP-dependent DNA helicase RecG